MDGDTKEVSEVRACDTSQRNLKDVILERKQLTIAFREFPNSRYTYYFDEVKLMVAVAQLEKEGWVLDYSTVMSDRASCIILSVKPVVAVREVEAKVIANTSNRRKD